MSCANLKGLDWEDPDFDVVPIGLTEDQIDRLAALVEAGGPDAEAAYDAMTEEAIRRAPGIIAAIRSGERPISDVFVPAPKKPPIRRKR